MSGVLAIRGKMKIAQLLDLEVGKQVIVYPSYGYVLGELKKEDKGITAPSYYILNNHVAIYFYARSVDSIAWDDEEETSIYLR